MITIGTGSTVEKNDAQNLLFSLVIPLHNEEDSIPILIPEIIEATRTLSEPFEVLLVNDASTDNTLAAATKAAEPYPYIKVLSNPVRRGQTGCYLTALRNLGGKYFLRMDGDLQDDPSDIPQFIKYMTEDADLIMGIRSFRKNATVMRLVSMTYDLFAAIAFNSPLHTNTSSFVAIKTQFLIHIPLVHKDHRYLPLIAMHRGATKLREIVVANRPRRFGKSKYTDIKKVLWGIPEVILFTLRLKTRFYTFPSNNNRPILAKRQS